MSERRYQPPFGRDMDDEGLGEEISQLSNEINGLYRVVSSRTSTPGAKMIYKPAAIENTVEELLSGIVGGYLH